MKKYIKVASSRQPTMQPQVLIFGLVPAILAASASERRQRFSTGRSSPISGFYIPTDRWAFCFCFSFRFIYFILAYEEASGI